jgi:glycosyltransferase involved in cell wall biosynthesis
MQDPSRRQLLVDTGLAQAKRFSWENTARQTIDGYRSLLDIISPA